MDRTIVSLSTKSAKLRVTAKCVGREIQLLSIMDRADEGVMVIVQPPKSVIPLFFAEREGVKEFRYSLHPSSLAEGYTITQNVKWNRPPDYSDRAFIESKTGELCWPIYTERCRYPHPSQEQVKPKKNDCIARLSEYNPSWSTLLYWVVALKNTEPSPLPQQFNARILEFKTFSVMFVWTYLDLPSLPTGGISASPNSPMKIGEKIVDRPLQGNKLVSLLCGPDDIAMFLSLRMNLEVAIAFHIGNHVSELNRFIKTPNNDEGIVAKNWIFEHARTTSAEPRTTASNPPFHWLQKP